jgi:hypothetical protein
MDESIGIGGSVGTRVSGVRLTGEAVGDGGPEQASALTGMPDEM